MTNQVVRENLVSLLSKSKNFPISIVVAPAGSGKSTLLDQWQQANGNLNVARLDLSKIEIDVNYILKTMLKNIRKTVEIFSAPIINLYDFEGDIPNQQLAKGILSVLNSTEEELYLVVDNFHYIESKRTCEILDSVISRLPKNIHIILSSRHYPRLNLTRLKLDGRILKIQACDLKFDIDQIALLGKHLCHQEFDEASLQAVMKSTEGWVAGIKIALMACHQQGARALDGFDGKQIDLVGYLATEVYLSLPDEIRSFFLMSSILDNFNAQLCDYVLHRRDSEQILKKLINRSMFIMPLPEKNNWYRYHALLSDFLRLQIQERMSEQEVAALHIRAGEFFIMDNSFELALHHFNLGKDKKSFERALIMACEYWLKQGEFDRIIGQLDKLPEQSLISNLKYALYYIHALIFYRRFNQAQYYLDLLPAKLHDARLTDCDTVKDVQFLTLSLTLFQHDTDDRNEVNGNDFLEYHSGSPLRMFSLVFAAYHELQKGSIDSALTIAAHAKAILSNLDYVLADSYIDLIIALCDRHMGRGIEAVNYINSLQENSTLQEGSQAWINLNTAMVIVSYEQNQLVKAQALCELLLPKITHSCLTEVISTIYLNLSRLWHIQGNDIKASRVLEQLERILMFGRYRRFTSQYVQESMRQAWLSGDHDRAQKVWAKHRLETIMDKLAGVGTQYCETTERHALALSYWHTFKGEYQKSASVLKELSQQLDACGAICRSLVVKANMVILDYYRGFEQVAVQRLCKLLKDYGYLKFSRTIFDEAPGLDKVFICAQQSGTLKLPTLFTSVFHDLFSQDKLVLANLNYQPIALTEKEQEVYLLMSSGLSNAQISREVGTALSTTKWHLKNIYNKLGITNRAQAILLQQADRA